MSNRDASRRVLDVRASEVRRARLRVRAGRVRGLCGLDPTATACCRPRASAAPLLAYLDPVRSVPFSDRSTRGVVGWIVDYPRQATCPILFRSSALRQVCALCPQIDTLYQANTASAAYDCCIWVHLHVPSGSTWTPPFKPVCVCLAYDARVYHFCSVRTALRCVAIRGFGREHQGSLLVRHPC